MPDTQRSKEGLEASEAADGCKLPVSSTRARNALSHWVNLSSSPNTHLLWYFMIILLLVSVKLSHKYRVEHRVLQSF